MSPAGELPASLAEPPGPQERVQRHTVEHVVDFVRFAPMVQILDAPVPQSGDQPVVAFKHFDISVPAQVIEVPHDLLPTPSSSSGSRRHADGGTVGGSARAGAR